MSKADEKFYKLGYEKTQCIKYIAYTNKETDLILFNLIEQTLCIHKNNTEFPAMNLLEIQAINEKCKELRMDTIDILIQLAFEQRTSISEHIQDNRTRQCNRF